MVDEPQEPLDGGAAPLAPHAIKKAAVLTGFAEHGNITRACREAGVGRRTHYDWLAKDPVYVLQFADAAEEAADGLEEWLRDRAMGRPVPEGRTKGDPILGMFLLKGMRPAKYRDNAKPDAEGAGTPEAGWEERSTLAEHAKAVLRERGVPV